MTAGSPEVRTVAAAALRHAPAAAKVVWALAVLALLAWDIREHARPLGIVYAGGGWQEQEFAAATAMASETPMQMTRGQLQAVNAKLEETNSKLDTLTRVACASARRGDFPTPADCLSVAP